MFKLSLPVQRFVFGCILLMFVIIGMNAVLNGLWDWSDQIQDIIFDLGVTS